MGDSLMIVRLLRTLNRLAWAVLVVFAGGTADGQNLVTRWTFDEVSGGNVTALDDAAPPATDGTLGTTATRTTDTPGGGAGFALDLSASGLESIVDGGDSAEVDGLTQFTLSTWVKVTGTTHYNEGGSVNVRLLAKQGGAPAFDGFSWNLNAPSSTTGSNDAFRMGLFVGGNLAFTFAFLDTDILGRGGDWLFLAVTYDGTSTSQNTRFYLGDETTPVAQLGSAATIAAGSVNPTGARFGVGFTDAAPSADTSLTGYQDDVRVYDGVLDAAALELVRQSALVGVEPDGDFNGDGRIDAADYVYWRKYLGGQDQYDAWRANFGQSGGSGGSIDAVPEPAAFLLLAIGAVAVAVRGPRVHRSRLIL
jgi:hypothetical protein